MIIRVERNKNYTVMSNHHLRNRQLSLAAKGLMSYMLSCTDTWKHSERSLATMHGCGRQKIRTALKDLESAGYLVRKQERDEKGRMAQIEYILYEQPPDSSANTSENPEPWSGKPTTEKPTAENPTVRNTKRKKYQNNNNVTARELERVEALTEQYHLEKCYVPVVAGFITEYGLEAVRRAIPYCQSRAKSNLMGYLHTVLEHGAILPEPSSGADHDYIPVPIESELAEDFESLSPRIRMYAEKCLGRQKNCEKS